MEFIEKAAVNGLMLLCHHRCRCYRAWRLDAKQRLPSGTPE